MRNSKIFTKATNKNILQRVVNSNGTNASFIPHASPKYTRVFLNRHVTPYKLHSIYIAASLCLILFNCVFIRNVVPCHMRMREVKIFLFHIFCIARSIEARLRRIHTRRFARFLSRRACACEKEDSGGSHTRTPADAKKMRTERTCDGT